MKIVGLMVAKDEELCCGMTVDTVKDIVDEIIFVDHMSKDRTVEIVKEKCKEFNIPLYVYQADSNLRLGDLHKIALIHGRKLKPDWFFRIEADLVFTNAKMVRELAEKGEYDQYWFRTLNLYGDMKNRRLAGLNIPHMWLFRNKKYIEIAVVYYCGEYTHKSDPNKERFIGWNLDGIKYYDRIFYRYQQWYQRLWNKRYGTKIGTLEFIEKYFNGEPSEQYKKIYVLNRLHLGCAKMESVASYNKIDAVEFKKKYMEYPDILKNWECPFELIMNNNDEVVGRYPDLVDVPLTDNEQIHQLKKEVLVWFERDTSFGKGLLAYTNSVDD